MTHSLRESGERLTGSAGQSSKGATEIATTINELAEGANDQADGATKGAMTAKDVLEKAEAIFVSIEDTVNSTELTKVTVEEGVESSKNLGNSINDLSKRADEIGDIINVITSIANQTNMLALNAAIEAARAGEVGKGFAVVADEVRKLAEGSTTAAQQISEIIVQIQSSVEHAKEQAGNSISMIEEQQTAVKHTQEAFNKINNVTQEAVGQVGKIAEATENIVESQAAASEESAASTEEITASVQEQTAAIEEVAHIANGLIDAVDELSALINRFKI